MDLDLAFAQFLATRDPAALEAVFERTARYLLRRARALSSAPPRVGALMNRGPGRVDE